MGAFDPTSCDLCGSREARHVVDWSHPRALRSDGEIVPVPLRKLECLVCGLVRGGTPASSGDLAGLYEDEYTVGEQPEHVFYTRRGPLPRSRAFADWIVAAVGDERLGATGRCLEVGAGSGRLLEELARRLPQAVFEGVEPGRGAAAARKRGFAVHSGDLDAAPRGPFDGAYSIAVIEHVPSPTTFLRQLRARVRTGGWVCLAQPTQDVPSYDVLFVDHLSHLGSAHVAAYAEKTGFREVARIVQHPWMPNFALHVLEAESASPQFDWPGAPLRTAAAESARRVADDVRRLDRLLSELHGEGRKVALFGTREVYSLARAYASLDEWTLVCALDDDPDTVDPARVGLKVVRPEEAPRHDVTDVILTMNAVYYEQATERLNALGLRCHPFLSA